VERPYSNLRCIGCGRDYPLGEVRYECDACSGLLEVAHDFDRLPPVNGAAWRRLFDTRLGTVAGIHQSGVWRFHELVLPDLPAGEVVSMPEGNTHLYSSKRLQEISRTADVRIKHEGENPTLSFKDRGMSAGVSWARHLGARQVACASTGDTSAAMAAYAAQVEGMRGVVVLPRGKVSMEQLSQPIAAGCLTVSLPADFDECIRLLRDVCKRLSIYLLNSVNPVRIEGQKSIAYEMAQQLEWDPPDWVVVPVGNAGNISALGKGFADLRALGIIDRVPRLLGAQPEAAAPLARAHREGYREHVRVKAKDTVATAIRIGDPVSYDKAVGAVRASGGAFISASEQDIMDAKALVDRTGVYVCPNSATAVAGFLKAREQGIIAAGERVVIIATAHGCKFSQATIDYHGGRLQGVEPRFANRVVEVAASASAIERLLASGPEGPPLRKDGE